MKNFVFIHIHRTGGSSIWHNLVPLGDGVGRGIWDLYHQSRIAYGTPVDARSKVIELRSKAPALPCLLHHHTCEPIRDLLDDSQTVYTTVLRDPVDRFVSLVHHMSDFFRSPETTAEYAAYYSALCSDDFRRTAVEQSRSVEELFEIASQVPFFASYYTMLFDSLCRPTVSERSRTAISQSELRKLAEETRRIFSVIGWFSRLESSFIRIVQTFGLDDQVKGMQMEVNRSPRRALPAPQIRRRLERALESEYAFVEQLRIPQATCVSKIA